ncbi:MAG TPA: hypothetical protein VGJ92_03095 [Methanocella sp.]
MEEWERRVAPGQPEEPYEGVFQSGSYSAGDECEPCWHTGDGLRVLNP